MRLTPPPPKPPIRGPLLPISYVEFEDEVAHDPDPLSPQSPTRPRVFFFCPHPAGKAVSAA
jgi:hypothetical protein